MPNQDQFDEITNNWLVSFNHTNNKPDKMTNDINSTDEKSARILIVDDAPENIQILGVMLKKENYQINVAQSGPKALEILEQVLPNLILLDITMPEMDGYEVCERIKQNPLTKDIPVIFLTAKTETESIVRAFDVGAVDYLTKPFRKKELLVRVRTHLELRRSKQELEQALAEIKTLKGIIPICASCKKIRDDAGYWNQVEVFIETHSDALFSHGICPDCADELYGDQEWYQKGKQNRKI